MNSNNKKAPTFFFCLKIKKPYPKVRHIVAATKSIETWAYRIPLG